MQEAHKNFALNLMINFAIGVAICAGGLFMFMIGIMLIGKFSHLIGVV